jgi:23S rRNA-/tRNA-specific pseudouridylate synthase
LIALFNVKRRVTVCIDKRNIEISLYYDKRFRNNHAAKGKVIMANINIGTKSHFEIQGQPVTRVALTPITGRSHQLRVHMQFLGHPIVGDTLYAAPDQQDLMPRLCLHAERLSFHHPPNR